MSTNKVAVGARHAPLRYLAIDGTHDLDSVVFGRELEKAGWKNLLRGTVARRPPAPGARVVVDPLHPFMPIFDTDGEKAGAPVVVVCPSGLSGSEDPHWSRYSGEVSLPNGRVLKGAKAAAELSARYAGTLLLRPAIQHSKSLGYHLADPVAAGSGAPIAADLLYVSSHGWLGGFMGGNWPELAVSPGGERVPFGTSYYLVIGRAARDGLGFSGPRWIVLAQCSTLNSATWPLWAAVLQNSSPHVRGILAYEESAPGSTGAATLARSFVSKLRSGMPLLKAWIAVNKAAPAGGRRRGRKWAAIVHEAARSDRLQDFGSFQPFTTVATTASSGPYRGYLDTNADGTPIRIKDPPFAFEAEMEHRGVFYPIDPARLDTNARYANAASNGHLRLTVAAPAGEALKAVRLDLIHIRPTYRPQISWAAVFSQVTPTPTAVFQGMRSSSLSIALRPSASKLVLLCSFGDVDSSGLERDRSHLWFRVGLRTESGMRLSHDFKTIGVVY